MYIILVGLEAKIVVMVYITLLQVNIGIQIVLTTGIWDLVKVVEEYVLEIITMVQLEDMFIIITLIKLVS